MSTNILKMENGFGNGERLFDGRTLPEREKSHPACHSFFLRLSRRGQQVGEYALLITAISAALLTMYIYTKRGLQGTIKNLTDHEIGWQNDSVPILASGAHQDALSTMGTKSKDIMRVKKDPSFGAQYEYSSVSTASGEGNATYNEF